MNPRPPGHILAAMSDEPTRSPLEQGAGRLEAFSDAVMAVIITLLAFQLKVPDGVTRQAIDDAVPFLFLYVLCFVLIAIYWNNHHHLLRAADRISGAAMWANMALLFCLSLVPVATEWIGTARRDHLDPVSPPKWRRARPPPAGSRAADPGSAARARSPISGKRSPHWWAADGAQP